jgi:outer membrane biosynthesis protein TonB
MLSPKPIHILFAIVFLPVALISSQRGQQVENSIKIHHIKDTIPAAGNDTLPKIPSEVDKEPEFPGGNPAWLRYLTKHLRYPDEAQNNEIQGDVNVKFLVDTSGDISEIHAISGPKELREESELVIRASGKWTPAVLKGKQVVAYKIQVLRYRLEVSK